MRTVVVAAVAALVLGGSAQQPFNYADEKDGDPATQAVCRGLKGTSFPASDRPTSAQAATLKDCDPEALYYGMGMPADPAKARQCAYAVMDGDKDNSFYNARVILMMIYANGVGAARNLDLATHLACTFEDSAPAEFEGRIGHLQEMKKAGARAETDFDICDDITSGYAMGFCASHEQDIKKIFRAGLYDQITTPWSPADRAAYATLERARDAYIDAHVENEVDVSGSGRAVFIIDAEESASEAFLKQLQELARGEPIKAPALAVTDRDLNTAYREIQNARDFDLGTVTKSGIRETQRVWIRYRDAWLAFAKVKYPALQTDALASALTAERTRVLKGLGD